MRWLVDAAYLLAGVLYLPVALYHTVILGKNRGGWGQRFGFVPRFQPDRRRIWIHAVSLGEINATPKLVEALGDRLPDCEMVFSTTTDTGFTRAAALYGADRVFRFPLDFSLVIAHVLRRVQPTLIVLVELEVWPNLTRMAARRGIPVVVVNGRLTAHSARRLKRFGRPVRAMFADLAWVGAQDDTIARRFRELGVPAERTQITSSLKWDTAAVADRVAGADALARAVGLDRARPLWVCGSTGPGEEAIILDAYRKVLDQSPARPACPTLVLVPRKPERFDEVAGLIEQAGFVCIRRSGHPDGAAPPAAARGSDAPPPVILGDTMGELRKFYSLADVAFVGRSLVSMGGSDPMEVAALGKPIVIGPHMDNFVSAVDALKADEAIRIVPSGWELAAAVYEVLSHPPQARELGARARNVVLRNQGATQRTAERIVDLMKELDRVARPGEGRTCSPHPRRAPQQP